MMKQIQFIFLVLFACASFATFGQESQETDKEAQAAMQKLAFIVGEWEGTGWMMGRDRQKHSFNQTEKIQFKLDGTAILIEGHGEANGKAVHDALAIVTYNKEDKTYNFRSYLASGRSGEFKAELIDGKFYWYPAENMRYIISLNEQGQWFEIGEIQMGENWFQFFEMTLDKQ